MAIIWSLEYLTLSALGLSRGLTVKTQQVFKKVDFDQGLADVSDSHAAAKQQQSNLRTL